LASGNRDSLLTFIRLSSFVKLLKFDGDVDLQINSSR
jgi:hypothetical protein